MSPVLSGEGKYFNARWIAPGDFYQGFGLTQDFHRIGFWAGRPRVSVLGHFKRTGITSGSFPYDAKYDSWSANEDGPGWFEWDNPSDDRFTVTVDYWFLAPAYLVGRVATVTFWQRRKRRLKRYRVISDH